VIQHGADLLEGDTRKPLHELGRNRTIFKVLEEGRHRYARATEHPSTAHAVWIAFDS
jgi:hypothetical protein